MIRPEKDEGRTGVNQTRPSNSFINVTGDVNVNDCCISVNLSSPKIQKGDDVGQHRFK